jgi:arylsulfatase A-like enzyme
MRIRAFTYAGLVAAVPASAQGAPLGITLLPGHALYPRHRRALSLAVENNIAMPADAAYATAMYGKWHLGDRPAPLPLYRSGQQLPLERPALHSFKVGAQRQTARCAGGGNHNDSAVGAC